MLTLSRMGKPLKLFGNKEILRAELMLNKKLWEDKVQFNSDVVRRGVLKDLIES